MKMQIVLLTLVLIHSPFGNACSCVETKLDDYYTNCRHLFTATLFEAEVSENDGSSVVGKFRNPRDIMAGDPSKIKGLRTSMMGTSCETDLIVGKRYLVCGNNQEYISISGCSLTQPIWWQPMQEKVDQLKSHEKSLTNKVD